jgi:hypothetical protein
MVVQVKVVLLDARQLRCNLAYTLSPSLGTQARVVPVRVLWAFRSLNFTPTDYLPLELRDGAQGSTLALYGEMLLRDSSSTFPDMRIGCTTIPKYSDSPRGREGGCQSRTKSSSMCVALLCCYHASTSVLILMYSPRQGAATERCTY